MKQMKIVVCSMVLAGMLQAQSQLVDLLDKSAKTPPPANEVCSQVRVMGLAVPTLQIAPLDAFTGLIPCTSDAMPNSLRQSEALAPPTAVVAMSGYHGMIPVAWKPVSSDTLTGYDVYRSTSAAGPYSRVAQSIKNCYYRDQGMAAGITYYYKIKSVYINSESGFSSSSSAVALENGYVIRSGYSTAAPTIDGVINGAEWAQAQVVDVLYPGLTGVTRLYVKNDHNRLFFAIDDQKNVKLDNSDGVGLFFDRDMDREWSSDAKAEGLIQVYWDNGTAKNRFMSDHGKWPDKITAEGAVVLSGISQAISAGSGHVQTEIAIDMRIAPFNYLPFGAMGFLLYAFDGANGQFYGAWPQETVAKLPALVSGYLWAYAPFSYGDLFLAQSEPSDFWADVDRDHDVDIMDIQLVAGRWGTDQYSANYLALYDVNSDGAIDIFDIQLVASWWNKPLPTIKLAKDAVAAAGTVKMKIVQTTPEAYEIWIDAAEDLAAFQVELAVKDAELKEMVLGDFLGTSGNTVVALPPAYDPSREKITLGAFSYGANTGAHGAGKLVRFAFTKATSVEVTSAQCSDKDGHVLAVAVEQIEKVPEEFRVYASHPNPFNSSTVITFSLPEAADVTMSLFNMRGQVVEERPLGVMDEGMHEVVWDAAHQPSGVYFCRISAFGAMKVIKLLLLR